MLTYTITNNIALYGYYKWIGCNWHTFIIGALFFYLLFYRTLLIPRFISVWGIMATITLFIVTIIKLFGVDLKILNALVLPMILNELFLACWLIIKGFNSERIVMKGEHIK